MIKENKPKKTLEDIQQEKIESLENKLDIAEAMLIATQIQKAFYEGQVKTFNSMLGIKDENKN